MCQTMNHKRAETVDRTKGIERTTAFCEKLAVWQGGMLKKVNWIKRQGPKASCVELKITAVKIAGRFTCLFFTSSTILGSVVEKTKQIKEEGGAILSTDWQGTLEMVRKKNNLVLVPV